MTNQAQTSADSAPKFRSGDTVRHGQSLYKIAGRHLSRSGWLYQLIWGGEVHERELRAITSWQFKREF